MVEKFRLRGSCHLRSVVSGVLYTRFPQTAFPNHNSLVYPRATAVKRRPIYSIKPILHTLASAYVRNGFTDDGRRHLLRY